MALSKGDTAILKEVARELIKEVLAQHIESCPYGRSLLVSKWFLIGLCIGSGVAGGGIVAAVFKMV